MSTKDEKNQEVLKEDAQSVQETEGSETESTGGYESRAGRGVLFFICGLVVSFIVCWVIFPQLLYSTKKQPINFNHALHTAEVGEGCASCHYLREDGSFSGVPKLSDCTVCHEEVLGVSEEEEKFVNEYVLKNKEVPWLIYSRQPACVFFSHAAHINMAKLECTVCHGHIGESTESKPYQENRITGYSRDIWGRCIAGFKKNTWDSMKMADCAECHAKMGKGEHIADVKNTVESHFLETLKPFFSDSITDKRGTSVQTQRDGCLVCHK